MGLDLPAAVGDVGIAEAPQQVVPVPTEDDPEDIDLPTLVQAYRHVDVGWNMSQERLIRTAEPRFVSTVEEMGALRRWNILVGLAQV